MKSRFKNDSNNAVDVDDDDDFVTPPRGASVQDNQHQGKRKILKPDHILPTKPKRNKALESEGDSSMDVNEEDQKKQTKEYARMWAYVVIRALVQSLPGVVNGNQPEDLVVVVSGAQVQSLSGVVKRNQPEGLLQVVNTARMRKYSLCALSEYSLCVLSEYKHIVFFLITHCVFFHEFRIDNVCVL
ncbi:hypothetical protein LXL04_011733 [Taraxacum kok-saghyz]